jgi:hypothetical protein
MQAYCPLAGTETLAWTGLIAPDKASAKETSAMENLLTLTDMRIWIPQKIVHGNYPIRNLQTFSVAARKLIHV